MLSTLPLLFALVGAPAAVPTVSPTAAVPTVGDTIEPALVRTDDKLDLRADFYPPRQSADRAPAVLLIHDAGASRGSLTGLAEALQRANFGVLALDLRGHGESTNDDYNWSTADEERRSTLWAFATRDVEAGARWLASQKSLHSTNLTVIGVGAGGALAVRHALRDENVRGVGLIGFQPQAHGFDVAADLVDLEGLPVLIAPAKEQRDAAESLVEKLEADDWITVKPLRSSADALFEDNRLLRSSVEWTEAHAMPRRGGRR